MFIFAYIRTYGHDDYKSSFDVMDIESNGFQLGTSMWGIYLI